MKTKPQSLYIHQKTGEMVQATKAAARKLPDDYKKVEFKTAPNGKPMARVRLDGGVTMDITERETTEVPENVNSVTN